MICDSSDCKQSLVAVVAELVRASYLIDTLTDPKVEGSNPGGGIFFRVN